jgi:hypothetical protein
MGRQCLARDALFLFCQIAKPLFYHLIQLEDAMQTTTQECGGHPPPPPPPPAATAPRFSRGAARVFLVF